MTVGAGDGEKDLSIFLGSWISPTLVITCFLPPEAMLWQMWHTSH